MTIITKLTQKDFIDVSFSLLIRKRSTKILIGIYCIFILSTFFPLISSRAEIGQAVFPLLFIAAVPLLIFFGAKRNYASDKRISETIEYKFERDTLVVIGESFNSQLSWNKIYKVTQSQNWLLIWHSAQIAYVIPKRDLWKSHLDDLKDILDSHGVQHNL